MVPGMDATHDFLPQTDRLPVLFLAHGSPMNAIEDNAFTRTLRALGARIARPAAVLVVSAHWMTPGSLRSLSTPQPRTIHDFYGFPRELYEVEYPAPGAPHVAREVSQLTGAALDDSWGLDHGTWSVLRHLLPNADVPVMQLSLDTSAPGRRHVELARALAPLRERGVLIVGSGNIVHNLSAIRWQAGAPAYDWAQEFDSWVAQRLLDGDVDALAGYESLGRIAHLAAPTNDHYLPLLYAAGLRRDDEPLSFEYEGLEMGSLSMRTAVIGGLARS